MTNLPMGPRLASESLLDYVVRVKILFGCADRVAALEDIRLSIDLTSLYATAKVFDVLKDGSAEDFALEFFEAYNKEVRVIF